MQTLESKTDAALRYGWLELAKTDLSMMKEYESYIIGMDSINLIWKGRITNLNESIKKANNTESDFAFYFVNQKYKCDSKEVNNFFYVNKHYKVTDSFDN